MIRGIDTQIMVQRTVEQGRQAAEQVGNLNQTKEFMAMMDRERAVHDTQSVNQTEHAENLRIRREKERQRRREEQERREREGQQEPEYKMANEPGLEIDIDV